jgi:hypothetical protein
MSLYFRRRKIGLDGGLMADVDLLRCGHAYRPRRPAPSQHGTAVLHVSVCHRRNAPAKVSSSGISVATP